MSCPRTSCSSRAPSIPPLSSCTCLIEQRPKTQAAIEIPGCSRQTTKELKTQMPCQRDYTSEKNCNEKEKGCLANVALDMEETRHARLHLLMVLFPRVLVRTNTHGNLHGGLRANALPTTPAMRTLQYSRLCHQMQAHGLILSLQDHSQDPLTPFLPSIHQQ
jgi:hypothetical protein